jgi:hypothetical protein
MKESSHETEESSHETSGTYINKLSFIDSFRDLCACISNLLSQVYEIFFQMRREPPTMGKQLVNFITCDCESSAPFL